MLAELILKGGHMRTVPVPRWVKAAVDAWTTSAGINVESDGPPSGADLSAVLKVLDTNFVGTLRVTQAMLPLLKKAPSARIVNVSSELGSLTLNSDPSWEHYNAKLIGYNASKAALNMLTVQLAWELRGHKH